MIIRLRSIISDQPNSVIVQLNDPARTGALILPPYEGPLLLIHTGGTFRLMKPTMDFKYKVPRPLPRNGVPL